MMENLRYSFMTQTPAADQITVRLLAPTEVLTCPESLSSAAGFPALDSWTQIALKVYAFPRYRLIAEQKGEVCGLLSLVRVRHFIFGDYLTTAPFASYGGFAFSSTAVRDSLLTKAYSLMQDLGADYVNVRFDGGESNPPAGWIQHPVYSTYRAELESDIESLLASYASDHRNHIRKSIKKGFQIKFGHLDLLDDAYEGVARSMHELGSPYHAKAYLRDMAESLGDLLEFAVLYGPRGNVAGAGVFIFQDRVATNLHANILRSFRSDYAGEFLYWSVIARYAQNRFRVFDMGRSLLGSGNETFKMKWRPRKQLLAYWYALKAGAELPELNQKNPKYQFAIWAWKHSPAFLVRSLGPALIKGLA